MANFVVSKTENTTKFYIKCFNLRYIANFVTVKLG